MSAFPHQGLSPQGQRTENNTGMVAGTLLELVTQDETSLHNVAKNRFMRDMCSAIASTVYKQHPDLLPLSFYLRHSSHIT